MSLSTSVNNVPPYQQPYPFWFWNGRMDSAEIVRQIGLMRQAGLTEFVIHGRTGLQTPFLSDGWFEAVGAAVAEARRTKMRVWIYDEYNWPSGTAASRITAEVANREHYIAADGSLRSEADPYRGPLSVDYLNPACTREFIRLCYQSYHDRFAADFGGVIRGFFNDEPRFCNPRPWSPSIPGLIPQGAEYYRRLRELIVANHFGLIRRWCDEHGALFTGHVMGEESLGSQVRYMADAWNVIDRYHHSGVDHLGRAAQGLHPRLAASIAHLTDNRPVTCETYAGCPWDFTPADLYRIAGWLYANGVTRILFHGFFYTRDGAAANDWPPDIFFRWAGWPAMPEFLRWAGRVQYFLARSRPRCRVALYYPLEEFSADFVPSPQHTLNYTDAARVEGPTARAYHLELGRLMTEMIRHGIDFDLVPRQLLHVAAGEGRVLVAPFESQPEYGGLSVPGGGTVLRQGGGTVLRQGGQTAKQCVARLDELLGPRVRVTGAGADARPREVSERLSDPYMHEGQDDGGVWARTFDFCAGPDEPGNANLRIGGLGNATVAAADTSLANQSASRPTVMFWNANAAPFDGRAFLADRRRWSIWTPADGQLQSAGETDTIRLTMPAHSMAVAIAE